ncbi:hypothetical protein SY88_01095 [Clostridiales bacterium PH28_bin88]|nr:hypothetical protein SY88_01095 [Clostridiales bacterium PH28_bin88]
MKLDTPAMILDGRTIVPMRAIFEAFGAKIEWKQETSTIEALMDDTYLNLAVGDKIAWLGRNPVRTAEGRQWVLKPVKLDVTPVILGGRTLVPVRFISESLGANVKWDGRSRTVLITTDWFGQYDPEVTRVNEILRLRTNQTSFPYPIMQGFEGGAVVCLKSQRGGSVNWSYFCSLPQSLL